MAGALLVSGTAFSGHHGHGYHHGIPYHHVNIRHRHWADHRHEGHDSHPYHYHHTHDGYGEHIHDCRYWQNDSNKANFREACQDHGGRWEVWR